MFHMLNRSTTILPLHRHRRLRPQGQLIPSIVTQINWIFCQSISILSRSFLASFTMSYMESLSMSKVKE